MPARVLAALVALLVLLPAATASASFDGSNGKVAYVDAENDLYIDDPFDDQPAQGAARHGLLEGPERPPRQ